MWIFKHEEKTTATREQVWAVWADLPGWPKWDETLETVTIDGPFESGTFGTVKPDGAKVVALELLDVKQPNSFVDVQLLPKAQMRTVHNISEADDGGLLVSHTITFSGPLGRVFSYILGRGMKRSTPKSLQKLVELAEAS